MDEPKAVCSITSQIVSAASAAIAVAAEDAEHHYLKLEHAHH
ncbi:MAG: hypothetical protein R3D43_00810 [Tepidamorphaceae bacterium]